MPAPDYFCESSWPASSLSEPGTRCWMKFSFQGVEFFFFPFTLKLEQSWEIMGQVSLQSRVKAVHPAQPRGPKGVQVFIQGKV